MFRKLRFPLLYLSLALLGLSIGSQLQDTTARKPPTFKEVESFAVSSQQSLIALDVMERPGHRFKVLSTKTGKPVGRELDGEQAACKQILFSGDGKTLAIRWGFQVRVYKAKTGKLLATFKTQEMNWETALSHNGQRLVIAAPNSGPVDMSVYDVKSGELLYTASEDRDDIGMGLVLDAKGKHLAYSSDGKVVIHRVADGKVRRLTSKGAEVNGLKTIAGGKILSVANVGGKNQMEFWKFSNGKTVSPALNHRNSAHLNDSTKSGDLVVTSYSTGANVESAVWNRKKGTKVLGHQGLGGRLSSDERYVGFTEFVGGGSYSPVVFDLETKTKVLTIPGNRALFSVHHSRGKLGIWSGEWTGNEWSKVEFRQFKLETL